MLLGEHGLQLFDLRVFAAVAAAAAGLQLLDQELHLLQLGHQLSLCRGRRRGRLLRLKLDDGGVLGKAQRGERVRVKLDFWANGAKQVRAGV